MTVDEAREAYEAARDRWVSRGRGRADRKALDAALDALLDAVRAEERAECVTIAMDAVDQWRDAARDIAAAIRARKDGR